MTYGRDRLIRLNTKGRSQIQLADSFEALGPVHMSGDVSPCRGKVVVIFNVLQNGGGLEGG